MGRYGLLVAGLLLLPVGGLTLSRDCPAPAGNPDAPRARDERLSEAVWRWRDCQPRHWHDCLLQR
jgi:hypothetical protein